MSVPINGMALIL